MLNYPTAHIFLLLSLTYTHTYHIHTHTLHHHLGDKKFDRISELVEDGLITLFMSKHNVAQALERGRKVTRSKTRKLTRQPARSVHDQNGPSLPG